MGKNSYIVGVAGGSASGKTTFVGELVKNLSARDSAPRVEVVGMDRYFYRGANGGPTFTSPSTGETLPDNNVPGSADNDRLVADLIRRRSEEDAPDVIVVEGLMTLHIQSIRELCDLRVFVDLEADIRALRRLIRDMTGVRGNPDPVFIASYYRECARVGHAQYVEPSKTFADVIIRGDSDVARSAQLISTIILARDK